MDKNRFESQETQDDIDALSIRKKTLTGTTNANGSINLDINASTYTVLSVKENNGYKVVPFVAYASWYTNVYDTSGTNFVAKINTSVNLVVYYTINA